MYRLVTTSVVESKILARADNKRQLNGLIVEAGEFDKQGASRAADDDDEDGLGLLEDQRKEMMNSLLKDLNTPGEYDKPVGPPRKRGRPSKSQHAPSSITDDASDTDGDEDGDGSSETEDEVDEEVSAVTLPVAQC